MRRHTTRTAAAILPVLAAAAALALAAVAAPSAVAGPSGSWATVATGQTNTSEPGLLRTGDGVLHVLWQRDDGATDSLRDTRIAPDGSILGTSVVLSGWDTIQNTPRLVPTGSGGLRAVFSGIEDATPPTGFHDLGRMYTAVSDASGSSWTLPDEALSKDEYAVDVQPGAGVLSDGTPVAAWASDGGFKWHVGTTTTPDSSTDGDASTGACCSYGASVATSGDTVWVAYYSNAAGHQGVWVRRALPSLSPVMKAPESTVKYGGRQQAIGQDSTQAFVGREGGGVFLAYLVGYPTADHIALWDVSDDKVVAVPGSKGATDLGIGRGPGGRLWIAWVDPKDHIRAVRTGSTGLRFGGVRVLQGPGTPAYDVFVDGSGTSTTKADVLVNTGDKVRHERVLPGMNAGAAPKAWTAGSAQKVVFSVGDAGVPLGGAEVGASGKVCTTDATGRCSITFAAGKPMRIVATVAHAGYADGSVRLRVRR